MTIENRENRNEAILNVYEGWLEGDPPALLGHLRANVTTLQDGELRESVYDLLYDKDPGFRDQIHRLYEESAAGSVDAEPRS